VHHLKQEFEKNPQWDKKTVTRVAKRAGLSLAQVYKWGWDQSKKRRRYQGKRENVPSTDEFGGYQKNGFSCIDSVAALVGLTDEVINGKLQTVLFGDNKENHDIKRTKASTSYSKPTQQAQTNLKEESK
jgi:hypothetical protein